MWHCSDPRLKQESNENSSDTNIVIEQGIKDLEFIINSNGTQEQIAQFKKLIAKAQSNIK